MAMNSSCRIKVTILVSLFLLAIPPLSPVTSSRISSPSIHSSTDQIIKFRELSIPQFTIIHQRLILYQRPSTPAPEKGYPVLFLLHGASQYPFAWFFPLNSWSAKQSSFCEKALDAGFFVIAPSSGRPMMPGPRAWSSFVNEINESDDLQLFQSLFDWIQNRSDTLDMTHVFCGGFSSGGFMTSRLAKVYPNLFSAVLVHSGTDADSITVTNRGPEFDCESPKKYPINHPPTLVVHGKKDKLVPYECGLHFYEELQRNNITSMLLVDEFSGHVWLSTFSEEMITWLGSHL